MAIEEGPSQSGIQNGYRFTVEFLNIISKGNLVFEIATRIMVKLFDPSAQY